MKRHKKEKRESIVVVTEQAKTEHTVTQEPVKLREKKEASVPKNDKEPVKLREKKDGGAPTHKNDKRRESTVKRFHFVFL